MILNYVLTFLNKGGSIRTLAETMDLKEALTVGIADRSQVWTAALVHVLSE